MYIVNENVLEIDQYERLIQGLIADQYGCIDDFMDENIVAGLRNKILRLNNSGKMHLAGIGKESGYQRNTEIRGDKIKWIEKDSEDLYERMFMMKIAGFMAYLNRTCYTSILDFECHYASFAIKTFYKRHLDQFKKNKGRKFSLIFYLNEDWHAEDGGVLSLYPKGGEQINIYPLGGRMVLFKSDEMEHEVHPSFTRDRISIACWLKN